MDSIEKYYKDRFKNKRLHSNDDESLWQQITDDLDQPIEVDQANSKGFFAKTKWLLIFLFISGCLVGGLKVAQMTKKGQTAVNKQSVVDDLEAENSLPELHNVVKSFSDEQLKESSNTFLGEAHDNILGVNIPSMPKVNLDQPLLVTTSKRVHNIVDKANNGEQIGKQFQYAHKPDSNVNQQFSTVLIVANNNLNSPSDEVVDEVVSVPTLERLPILPLQRSFFPIIALTQIQINQSTNNTSSSLTQIAYEKKYANRRPLSWHLDFTVGLNKMVLTYQSTADIQLAELKTQAQERVWGQSFGIHLTRLWKDRWSLKSGLEYHQVWSRFKYDHRKEFQKEKLNQLLSVSLNANTGDTLFAVYGDTTVNATTVRNVIHYNKFKTFSIPLEVGFQKNIKKFRYGITTGFVFNFTTLQEGKGLDISSDISEFDKESTISPFEKFDLGLRGSLWGGYRFSNNCTFIVRPQWMWRKGKELEGTDINARAIQFNLNVSLGLSF